MVILPGVKGLETTNLASKAVIEALVPTRIEYNRLPMISSIFCVRLVRWKLCVDVVDIPFLSNTTSVRQNIK